MQLVGSFYFCNCGLQRTSTKYCSCMRLYQSETSLSDGSFASVLMETDKKELAIEVTDSLSCPNTNTRPHSNDVKLRHTCSEGVQNDNRSSYVSEHRYGMVCEGDLSVFFGSPATVSSLSTKLKAIPKRKATFKCKHEVKADCLHSCNDAFAYSEHELDDTRNCINLPQQCLLPLDDVLTRNIDKPCVGAYVTVSKHSINENSDVGQSSSIQLSLPISDTSQCHLAADLNGDIFSNNQSSTCQMSLSCVAVLPPSSFSLVVPLQGQRSSCLGSVYSAVELPIGFSVVLDEWSGDMSTRLVSQLSGTQVYCCEQKPLQKLVKHRCTNNQRFLYPSAAQAYHSSVINVFKRSYDDKSRSLLYQTPHVLQSGCQITHSKAEASLVTADNECSCSAKERIVEGHDVHEELLLTSQSESCLLTASDFVSCALNRTVVTSCRNMVCDMGGVNKDAACDGMSECTVMETYRHIAEKMPSEDVIVQSAASLPSLVDSFCRSRPTCDFAGQTSPCISSRMAFCDVGVQTDLKKLALELEVSVNKQPLHANAAVQTLSQCTCSFNSQNSDLRERNELWHSHDLHNSDCDTTTTMNCKLLLSNVDILSVSDAGTCEKSPHFCRFAFQNADTSGSESSIENCYDALLLSCRETKIVNVSNQTVTATNTTCISTTVNCGNRCTVTISEGASPVSADVHHALEVPQFSVSNKSSVNCFSAEVPSSDEAGKLLCSTVDRDLDSVKMVTTGCVLVTSDVSLNSTNVFPDSCSTGFISAGGKPLSVKLSSKLNACKLVDELACAEVDHLENAAGITHFSNTGFPASNGYSTRRVGQDLFQNTTSGFMDSRHGNVSDCCINDASVSCSSKVRNQQHCDTVHAYSLNARSMSSESTCDRDVFGKSSASLTSVSEFKSANKKVITACAATHQLPSSSFINRVPDMLTNAKQFTGNECRVNADNLVLNCGVTKSHSKSVVSNGLKSFKVPRPSMQSSKDGRNNLSAEIHDECLPCTSIAQSHSLKSEDKVKDVDETELLHDLTNTQLAEVVDASLLMLNSAELFAVPCSDDVNELVAEQLVSHSSAAVNVPAPGSYCSISTDNDNVPKYYSPVCMISNAASTCKNLLTGHMQLAYNEADTEAVKLDNRLQSVTRSSVVPLHSDGQMYIEKPGKLCNSTSGRETDISNKALEVDKNNPTHKNSPFVFFSAKGSQINVNEKTLHSVRENWNDHLNGAKNIGVESRKMVKVADVNELLTDLHSSQGIGLQTTTEDMHASSVASDTYTHTLTVEELIKSGSCSRNAIETNKNTLLSVPAVDMHPADVQSASVLNKVFEPNINSVQIFSDVADISNGCLAAVSADISSVSCSNSSVYVTYTKTAEHKLPFRSSHSSKNDAEAGYTDQNVLVPLHTIPESK